MLHLQLRLRHLPRMVAWCGVPECASTVFIEENGVPFTLTRVPRIMRKVHARRCTARHRPQ